MMNYGDPNVPYAEDDCKELDDAQKEPVNNDKVKKKLANEKVTTSAAKSAPPCPDLKTPMVGTSCSGFFRRHVKKLLNPRSNIFTKQLIECVGPIVLSPKFPAKKPKLVKVKFCDKYEKELDPNACHAEVSILSTLGKSGCLKPNTKLLFNINWTANPDKLKMPCSQCHNLMKALIAEPDKGGCGLNIEICSESGAPVKIEAGETHENLATRVMNGPKNIAQQAMDK